MSYEKAYTRLHTMGDWLELQDFDSKQIMRDLDSWKNEWKPYNRNKPNNRFGLSITSLDGGLGGIPDLDSLYEYNKINGTDVKNHDIKTMTPVYDSSRELQKIIEPWKPWLGRCHFLKLNAGGYVPEHYDINKLDYAYDEIRLIGFVNKSSKYTLKFLYEDKLLDVQDGSLYWFNANKRHSVFSMTDDCIMIVFCLKFDEKLFETVIKEYQLA